MSINTIFQELANESGKNAKLAILKTNANNDLFKRVCSMALDPHLQFYIRKIPSYTPKKLKLIKLETALDRLELLSSRKLTGHAAIDHLSTLLSELSSDDAEVLERVIKKDLRCGVDTAVDDVWPGLIPSWPCMLASPMKPKNLAKIKFPAYVQLKLDGMRFNAVCQNGSVEFFTRQGRRLKLADPELAVYFLGMANGYDVVFDGELICRDKKGKDIERKIGNGIINKALESKGCKQTLEEGQMVCAVLWDVIPLEDFFKGKSNNTYKERLHTLLSMTNPDNLGDRRVTVVSTFTVNSLDECTPHFNRYLAQGLEGIVLKEMNMPWEDKRSAQQVKFKGEYENEMVVVGWEFGKEGRKNAKRMGGLICESADGKVSVSVGGGWSEEERDTIKLEDVKGMILTVRHNGLIADKKRPDVLSIFLPRAVEFREDKTKADKLEDFSS